VLDENGPDGQFNQTVKTEAQVDSLMHAWMGIDFGRYIKMPTLPYDVIHHIDMHMKLLDEETLLVGEFPVGTSDGPQIEDNLDDVLANYNSVFGTPYKVIRIPMVPSTGGNYPPGGSYRTYTNFVFVNGTVLVPTYRRNTIPSHCGSSRKACPVTTWWASIATIPERTSSQAWERSTASPKAAAWQTPC
jgi:agmatine deiminase